MAIIKHKEQRVGVFIDAQNLYHSAKNLYKKRVDFASILKDAVGGRKLIRSIAYVITTETGEEKPFFEALIKANIETKTKNIQVFLGGAKKADWDVGIAIDAITLSPKLDAAILISGDGDFVPLCRYMQIKAGVQFEVMAFGKSASSALREEADNFIDLGEDPKKYLIGYNNKSKKKSKK